MAGEFRATTDQLRSVAGGLNDLGSEYDGIASELRAQVGDGGDVLTPGDAKSFWTQFDWLVGSLEAKANLMNDYGHSLMEAAEVSQGPT
jgi:hypothetical protein